MAENNANKEPPLMRECRSCKKVRSFRFCPEDGSRLTAPRNTLITDDCSCAKSTESVHRNHTFCTTCGGLLPGRQKTEHIRKLLVLRNGRMGGPLNLFDEREERQVMDRSDPKVIDSRGNSVPDHFYQSPFALKQSLSGPHNSGKLDNQSQQHSETINDTERETNNSDYVASTREVHANSIPQPKVDDVEVDEMGLPDVAESIRSYTSHLETNSRFVNDPTLDTRLNQSSSFLPEIRVTNSENKSHLNQERK